MTTVSILTAVHDPPLEVLDDTIASVLAQTHQDWEWVVVDDVSPNPEVRARLRTLAARQTRVRLIERAVNGGVVAASADALAAAGGEWVALLDHDDVLEPDALAASLAALAAAEAAGTPADYCYSDQDLMRPDGRTHSRFGKPDWSPERLRHHNYATHLSVLRRALVVEVGGFREGYGGSQDHDLVLRVTERARGVVHVPRVLYHWREAPGSVAADAEAKPYAWDAGVRAVQDHLDRVGIGAVADKGSRPGHYVVRRTARLDVPVSVVIPTRGTRGLAWGSERLFVREAISSARQHSALQELEFVVVVDTSTPAAVTAELEALPTELAGGAGDAGLTLRLVPYDKPFNFSEKCNLGALHAAHDTLVFLNDDVEVVSEGMLEQLVAPLDEPGVGMTGARLLFENTRIQHGGVVYGDGDLAHLYYGAMGTDLGYQGELVMNREVTALTGACLAVRRAVFEEVGGFSEAFPVNYNDLDLSLKVGRLGLRRLWLRECTLFHFESMTRSAEVAPDERRRLQRRWGDRRVVRERYAASGPPGVGGWTPRAGDGRADA